VYDINIVLIGDLFLLGSNVTDSLLTTKFFIPSTRPELFPRPRLIEKLNEGLHRKLTLISAPAGFCKTTLVTVINQAALQGILKKNRNLNLELISVNKIYG